MPSYFRLHSPVELKSSNVIVGQVLVSLPLSSCMVQLLASASLRNVMEGSGPCMRRCAPDLARTTEGPTPCADGADGADGPDVEEEPEPGGTGLEGG